MISWTAKRAPTRNASDSRKNSEITLPGSVTAGGPADDLEVSRVMVMAGDELPVCGVAITGWISAIAPTITTVATTTALSTAS